MNGADLVSTGAKTFEMHAELAHKLVNPRGQNTTANDNVEAGEMLQAA